MSFNRAMKVGEHRLRVGDFFEVKPTYVDLQGENIHIHEVMGFRRTPKYGSDFILLEKKGYQMISVSRYVLQGDTINNSKFGGMGHVWSRIGLTNRLIRVISRKEIDQFKVIKLIEEL